MALFRVSTALSLDIKALTGSAVTIKKIFIDLPAL
jgi:hypothetical protein